MKQLPVFATAVAVAIASIPTSPSLAEPDPFLRQTTRQLDQILSARAAFALIDIADASERRRDLGGWYHFDGQQTVDDDFPVELDALSYQPMVGLEYAAGRLTVGVAGGYNGVDAEFRAAPGVSFPKESVDASLWSVAPYLDYAFGEHVFATLIAGYQRQQWSRFENLVPRDLDADAGFWNAGLHALGELGDDALRLQGDVSFTHEMAKRSRQSVAHDFIGSAGVDASLPLGSVSPYARSWYELAFDDDDSPERHTFYIGGGLRFALSDRVSFDLGGWSGIGHRDLRETGLSATLRFLGQ